MKPEVLNTSASMTQNPTVARPITASRATLLKDPDKDRDRIIEAYRRGRSWTAAAKLLGISERALLEQRKRHGINKKDQVES